MATACGAARPSVEATDGAAPVEAPVEAPEEAPAEGGPGRLDVAALDALQRPAQSACTEDAEGLELPGGCRALGPFPGELPQPGGPEVEDLAAALRACAEDPGCPGVSSPWYIGAPWRAGTAARFEVNTDSYGCTFVLDCR